LKAYVAAILKNHKYDTSPQNPFIELDHDHSKFIYELLNYHPKAKTKLKNLSKILVGTNYMGKRSTKCFFIEKTTSEKEDISYVKACNMAYEIFSAQNSQNLLNAQQKDMAENIMNFIAKLMKLYPLSLSAFPSYLAEIFPHRRLDEMIQRIFFTNILKLSLVYFPLKYI